MVADKNCEKIHYIAPNIYCCGAGTAADTENVTGACLQPGCLRHLLGRHTCVATTDAMRGKSAQPHRPGHLHTRQCWAY